MLGNRARLSAALINGLSGKPRRPQGGADPGANLAALSLPIITINMNDWPARLDPEQAAIGRPSATARRLVEASVSPNTRRAYVGALRRLDAWLDGRELHDVTLAAYLAELHDAGRASSSASMAVAAACFRAKLAGQPAPAGERTSRVLAGYRRTSGDRGRGQARPFGVSDLAAVLATCHRPRRRGRGVESRPDRHRAGASRCGDNRVAVHGGDAAQRGERAALGPPSSMRPTATAFLSPCAGAKPIRRARRTVAVPRQRRGPLVSKAGSPRTLDVSGWRRSSRAAARRPLT